MENNTQKPWWYNEESKSILDRGYLLKGETLEKAIDRITDSVVKNLGDIGEPNLKERFTDVINKGWLSLSSPIWSNSGTERGLPISCMGCTIDDSINSIIKKHGEVAMHTKKGSGTSGYFGNLRGRGATITDNGESSGSVSFMKMFDTLMNVVSQGSCYVEGTEVLTDKGFKDFRDVNPKEDKIAQITKDNKLIYTTVGGYELTKNRYKGDIITFRDTNDSFEIHVTPNHRMMFSVNGGELQECQAKDLEVYDTWDFHLTPKRYLSLKETYRKIAEELETLGGDFMYFIHNIASLPNESNLISACVSDIPEYLVDRINTIFLKNGFTTYVSKDGLHYELVYYNKENTVSSKYIQKYSKPYNGMVYCCIVPEGRIFVRYNGKTLVSGNTRRGSFAAYLDIDHPDIKEFLRIRSIGNEIQNLFHAVCVPDYWMKEMIDGDEEKREIWASVITSRRETGLPYIFFTDNVNKNKPDIYKTTDSFIYHSNLCMEIALPDTSEETFICCLCSLNLALYDEWKDTDLPKLATYFLDGVMSEYINKTEGIEYLLPARNFSIRHRAIGIGVMGWHSYLQSKMIPFEGLEANFLTNKIFKKLQNDTKEASKYLAEKLGPAPIFLEDENYEGIKYRNTTTMAIAPTTSSSAILGQVSPGIEPYMSNYYKAGLAKGNFIRKNKYLEELLKKYNKNTDDVWRDIMMNKGSVQQLDFLSDEEKSVFKTFREISQHDIITQAAIRQKYIDQGQSLNINIPAEVSVKEINKLLIYAWEQGIKGLYYQRSSSISKDMLTNIVSCTSCES